MVGTMILAATMLGQLDNRIVIRETTGGIGGSVTVQYQIDTNNRWSVYTTSTDGFIERLGEGKLKIADSNRLKDKLQRLNVETFPDALGDLKPKVGPGHHCVTIRIGGTKKVTFCNNHPRINGSMYDNVEESSQGYKNAEQMMAAAKFADLVIEACTPLSR